MFLIKKIKQYWKLIVIGFGVVLGAIGVYYIWNPKIESFGKSKKNAYVVSRTSLNTVIDLSGSIDAEKRTTLRFPTSGKLIWVGVKEGDRVSKGQIIAQLDQRELKKKLNKSLQDFLVDRWDLAQKRDDYKGQYTGIKNKYFTDEATRIIERSQFGVNKAIIDVEIASLALEMSRLTSPINGIVVRIDQPNPGVNITPAQAEFEIIDPETIYLKATVDQQDVVEIKQTSIAEIVFDAYPNKKYKGLITYISYVPEKNNTSSYMVKIKLPRKLKNKLRIGMTADASITTKTKRSVLAIPIEAVYEDKNNQTYVYVKNNGTEKKTSIKTGIETIDKVEVVSGLRQGQVVVY